MAHPIQFNDFTGDPSPVKQRGVRDQIPGVYYGGPAFGWVGRLSDLVSNSGKCKFKIDKGFLPRRYVVKAEPIPGDAYIDADAVGAPLFLKEGAACTIATASTVKGVTISDAVIRGPYDGSDSDSDADEPATGIVAYGAINGEMITDDDTWITLTATPANDGDVKRNVSDCYIEVFVDGMPIPSSGGGAAPTLTADAINLALGGTGALEGSPLNGVSLSGADDVSPSAYAIQSALVEAGAGALDGVSLTGTVDIPAPSAEDVRSALVEAGEYALDGVSIKDTKWGDVSLTVAAADSGNINTLVGYLAASD